jgi:predicted nucleotidyltransferase
MSPAPDQLVARLREAAQAAFDGTGVFLAYAHGSRVHGRPRADSDLDVAYYAGGYPGTVRLPIEEELRLAAELGCALGLEVDLRPLAGAPLDVRGRVLERGARVYCSDDVARVNLERELLTRWLDWKPAVEKMVEERMRAFAEKGLRRG